MYDTVLRKNTPGSNQADHALNIWVLDIASYWYTGARPIQVFVKNCMKRIRRVLWTKIIRNEKV